MSQLPDYAEALARATEGLEPLDTETVALAEAAERVTAEAITADRDIPPFDRAALDGYAFRAADLADGKSRLRVIGDVPAGSDATFTVGEGECVRIATGAPVPKGADAVIGHEQTDQGESEVTIKADAVEAGHAVHPRGADARKGDEVIAAGTRLRPQHLGILAAVGCAEVPVVRRPRVVILTSGDEVRPVEESVGPHQIRNSNRVMLSAMLRMMGAEIVRTEHLTDESAPTIAAVAEALGEVDVLVSVGGISAGRRDRFHDAYAAAKLEVRLAGAAIQPGKPVYAARYQPSDEKRRPALVLGLPGNPVSVVATAHLFVWPVLRILGGEGAGLPWREGVEVAEEVRPNPKRRAFRPAVMGADGRVRVPAWQGSGDLVHTGTATGLLELPPGEEAVSAGARLRYLPFAWGG